MTPSSLNHEIAAKLREAADLLDGQGANPFRVGAYTRAAETVASLDRSLADILERRRDERRRYYKSVFAIILLTDQALCGRNKT